MTVVAQEPARTGSMWSAIGLSVPIMSGAAVHILGWDGARQVWLARRDGEPSFVWVQGFDDAYLAACVSRDVALIVPAAIYGEWVAAGDAGQMRVAPIGD